MTCAPLSPWEVVPTAGAVATGSMDEVKGIAEALRDLAGPPM